MNILTIAVLLILIGFMIWGYWRGFIRIAFSLVVMLLTIVLVSWATPYLSDFLKENTSLYEDLAVSCSTKIQAVAEGGGSSGADGEAQEPDGGSLGADGEAQEPGGGSSSADGEAQEPGGGSAGPETLEGLQLPSLWMEQLLDRAGQTLEDSGIYRQAGEYIADLILRGVAFFAAFLLVTILLRFAVGILDILAKLPVIKGVNRLLGGLAGLLQGLLLVWLLLLLTAIACTSQLGQTLIGEIQESAFLSYLYNHNAILYLFSSFFG